MGKDLKIPIGDIGEAIVGFIIANFHVPIAVFSTVVTFLYSGIFSALSYPPFWLWILIVTPLAWYLANARLAFFGLVGLLIIANQGLWDPALQTLSLTLTAAMLSFAVALPLGTLIGESAAASRVLNPILDFVQTMPRFVYLIPAVVLFGIDIVPAVFATMTLAIVPPTRIIALGISKVDPKVVEAAEAFGTRRAAIIWKIKLPLAKPALLLAANQCLMMALSMAVISALIGAGGLGANVLNAIATLNAGQGFVAGFGILVLAILVDRMMSSLDDRSTRSRRSATIAKAQL